MANQAKEHLDLTANPPLTERRRLIREDIVIATLPAKGGGFHGVVVPRQSVEADERYVAAFICRHRHQDLTGALTCANELANTVKSS